MEYYLDRFNNAAKELDMARTGQMGLIVSTGIVMDSVCLKIYKPQWTNDLSDPLHAEARIFFSVWISERALQNNKLLYNIHAFKLRKLKGYSIAARVFADDFRRAFRGHQSVWDNVSTAFGPLTLMEGWVEPDELQLERNILRLAGNFLDMAHLIDDTLLQFKRR